MRIKRRVVVKYNLIVKTGLHIGGSNDVYSIGGTDAQVYKDPLTGKPVIPGSSVKGKLRMLLETVTNDKNSIEEAFGATNNPMTRVVFRDLFLSEKSAQELQDRLGFGFYTEVKAENKINRETGTADSPRFIERVPAGSVFEGEFVVNYLEGDQEGVYEKLIAQGFSLLENNYLGGSGSRGYGKVKYSESNDKQVL
jgi:CRISPR-associated protein Csm3